MIVKLIHSCLLLGIGIFIFFKEKKIYIYQYHQSSTFVKKDVKYIQCKAMEKYQNCLFL